MNSFHSEVNKQVELAEKIRQVPPRKLGLKYFINRFRKYFKRCIYRCINSEWNDEDTGQHVHDGDGEEEEVMGSVEVITLLDDVAEDEVAHQTHDQDGEVEDHVTPAWSLIWVS